MTSLNQLTVETLDMANEEHRALERWPLADDFVLRWQEGKEPAGRRRYQHRSV